MNPWKITYMTYTGEIRSIVLTIGFYDLLNITLPNSSGTSSILKIEKLPIESASSL